MMMRRNVHQEQLFRSGGSGSAAAASSARGSHTLRSRRSEDGAVVSGGGGGGLPVWFLILLAIGITMLTYWLPEVEQEVEKEVVQWMKQHDGKQQPPKEQEGIIQQQPIVVKGTGGGMVDPSKDDPTKRMLQQSSRWVDGEKKLKLQLKKLVELQRQGKEIGVPVLTRYLGEDFPAWAGEGVNKEEWEKKVADKYVEMRKAEDEWNAMVEEAIQKDKQRG